MCDYERRESECEMMHHHFPGQKGPAQTNTLHGCIKRTEYDNHNDLQKYLLPFFSLQIYNFNGCSRARDL